MPTQHSIVPGSLDTEMNIYDEAMTNSDDIEKKKNEGKTIGMFKKGKAGKTEVGSLYQSILNNEACSFYELYLESSFTL